MATLLLVAGLALLVAGAELLVRGASRLAAAIGISPLVIGLTVVAVGTSSPEPAVSAGPVWADESGVCEAKKPAGFRHHDALPVLRQ